jgi:hypothetical protein
MTVTAVEPRAVKKLNRIEKARIPLVRRFPLLRRPQAHSQIEFSLASLFAIM